MEMLGKLFLSFFFFLCYFYMYHSQKVIKHVFNKIVKQNVQHLKYRTTSWQQINNITPTSFNDIKVISNNSDLVREAWSLQQSDHLGRRDRGLRTNRMTEERRWIRGSPGGDWPQLDNRQASGARSRTQLGIIQLPRNVKDVLQLLWQLASENRLGVNYFWNQPLPEREGEILSSVR